MKDIAITIIQVMGPIIVALITFFMNQKIKKSEDTKKEILKEVQKNRDDYRKEMSAHILENDKTYLTDFLSDIEAGEPKSEIQVRRAYEIKKEYNEKGGDSYIDDKWEELIKKGILKNERNREARQKERN